MNKVGFGIFGRPVGHEFVSNGLFEELRLEDETYLNPDLVLLNPGERLVQISRQFINDSQIIKVYIYDYAESFNKRKGGFVGSAYVFSGRPKSKLLYNGVNFLHSKVNKLLDNQSSFVTNNLQIHRDELLSPAVEGLVEGIVPAYGVKFIEEKVAVLTDGPVLNHLMSVVQGFMYNPNFRNIQSVYTSDNEHLLKRLLGTDSTNLLGIGHILYFDNHFQTLNRQLTEKREQIENLQKEFESIKAAQTSELNNNIERLKEDIKEKTDSLNKLESDFIQKSDQLRGINSNIQKKENQQKNLKEEVYKLSNEKSVKFPKFKDIFKKEIKEEIRKSKEVDDLNERIEELEEEIARYKPQNSVIQKLAVFGGILLLFMAGGYLLGDYFPLINKNNNTPIVAENRRVELPNSPKPMSFEDYNNLTEEERSERDSQIKLYIDSFKDKKDDFLSNDWNLAELIDTVEYDINNPLKGVQNLDEIFSLKSQDTLLHAFLGFPSHNSKIKKEEMKIKSDEDLLKQYLDMYENKSIYSNLSDEINLQDNKHIQMHFRWMVWKLSDEEIDLEKTTDKINAIPVYIKD